MPDATRGALGIEDCWHMVGTVNPVQQPATDTPSFHMHGSVLAREEVTPAARTTTLKDIGDARNNATLSVDPLHVRAKRVKV